MMILIWLVSDDWLDMNDYVFYMLEPAYISDLKDEYTDDVKEEILDLSSRLDWIGVDLEVDE